MSATKHNKGESKVFISLFTDSVSNQCELNREAIAKAHAGELCPGCLQPFRSGAPISAYLKGRPPRAHLVSKSCLAIVSVELLQAMDVDASPGRIAVGPVIDGAGRTVASHVSVTSVERIRFSRDKEVRRGELMSCMCCNRIFSMPRKPLSACLPEYYVQGIDWFFGDFDQLFLSPLLFEKLRREPEFGLDAFARKLKVVPQALDGISDEELYPNPSVVVTPEGKEIRQYFNGWAPKLESNTVYTLQSLLDARPKAPQRPPSVEFRWSMLEKKEGVKVNVCSQDEDRRQIQLEHRLGRAAVVPPRGQIDELCPQLMFTERLAELWSEHDGAKLYVGPGSEGLIELHPVRKFKVIQPSWIQPYGYPKGCRILVIGKPPSSSAKVGVVCDGPRAGTVIVLDRIHGTCDEAFSSVNDLLVELAQSPAFVADAIGSTFRVLIEDAQYRLER